MKLLFYYHPAALEHDAGPGHPEAAVRLRAIHDAVVKADLHELEAREPPEATIEQLARVHPEPYPSRILAAAPASGWYQLDGDTAISPGSPAAALRAAGASCAAVDAVVAGEAKVAFCAMRPPGHHAEPDQAMGFCLFNNVAIGALQARAVHGVGRIVILDFDVHHGNGTQAAFWHDPDTLYVSTHQSGIYPGTGFAEETGAYRNILNRPQPAGTGSQAWRRSVSEEVLPAIDAWRPDLILLSAGFDAHMADPLAQMRLVEDDFAWVTHQIVALAERHARGRIVSCLEGGYHPPALARSVVAHLKALVGL